MATAPKLPGALHEVSGRGLVLPREPEDDLRALNRTYTRYLAGCCRRFLALRSRLDPALRPGYERIAALVKEALSRRPRPMLSCFASPMVGTPLRCLELRDHLEAFRSRIDEAGTEMLPQLLLEMALRRLIPDGVAVVWEHGAPPLASIALGGELVPPEGATGLRFSAGHLAALGAGCELARVPTGAGEMRRALAGEKCGFRFERCFHPVGRVTHFATIDRNPIAAFEAHPEKAGNHVDLGSRSEAEWMAALGQSFALIERFLPGLLAEMRILLHQVIPVGFDEVRHLSASYREAVGTAYLTLHPNPMTMTEAVIHEFQHNKLNVAAYDAEYLVNGFSPLYRSPIRPDPRPLWGILLAVHAFLPVAELYRRMRDAAHPMASNPEFERRLSEIDLKNHEGMEMLRAHAELTPPGRALLDDLEALERRHLADRAARGLDTTPSATHLD